jgi:thymidylate synthase (FAD)
MTEILEFLYDRANTLFANNIVYSLIGARVCYSKKSLDELLKEDYFSNKTKAKEFLKKLTNYKHYSVFGHSYTYISTTQKNIQNILATKFKAIYNPNYSNVIGLSLRHFLEDAKTDNIRNMLIDSIDINFDVLNDIMQKENVYLLHYNNKYDGYAVFYIENVSRAATHQIVRHTILNYSQKSQRYVLEQSRNKELQLNNKFYIPDKIKENEYFYNKYMQLIKEIQMLYKEMVENDISAEDARYILPNAQYSTIVVSGSLKQLYDFIDKRKNKDAQKEIREIALKMYDLLESKK